MTEGDGRHIDPRLGLLTGEGAQQRFEERKEKREPWSHTPSAGPRDTYYDLPAIKEPVWIWSVPAYFYAGGAAGAAATLGAVAQSVDRDGLADLVRNCRVLAAAGTSVGTVLLIIDLGRPERFMNMLRVFRPTSPLNVGSWVLAASATSTAAAAVLSNARGAGPRRLGDVAGRVAGAFGLPLSGYTAVLLTNTVVPVWQAATRSLPALFVASAASSAASLLSLTNLGDREKRIVERFGFLAEIAELSATFAVEREVGRNSRVARPLGEGVSGILWKAATACTLGSLLLSHPARRSRVASAISSLLGVAGPLAMRFGLFHAGKASARDPRATFEAQRASLGAVEASGLAGVAGAKDRRAPDRSPG